MASSSVIPRPGSITPIPVKDKYAGYSYIEFPQDTIFLESMSSNDKFRPHVAFVPAQRVVNGVEETHLYEITPGQTTAKHIAGPLAAPDGSTDVTVFGSALTSSGLWYLCAFNRNSIIAVDLSSQQLDGDAPQPITALWEVPDLPSPNDVCFDPQDESTLYVVGGTFRGFGCGGMEFSNSAHGQVFKVNVHHPAAPTVDIQAQGLKTLAGVEVVGDKLWLAQLYDMLHQPKEALGSPTTVAWQGNDGKGNVWLADNIDVMENKETGDTILLCPAYSTVSEGTVNSVMKRSFMMSAVLFYYQVSTAFSRGERFGQAIRDPEVSLSFSNTYVKEGVAPAPVRLILMTAGGEKVRHFEVDLEDTRANNSNMTVKDLLKDGQVLGERYYFNEQVTHTGHLRDANGQGYLACINFECPRILLLKEDKFLEAFASSSTEGPEGEVHDRL